MSKCNAGYCGCQGDLIDIAPMGGILQLHETPPDDARDMMWFAFAKGESFKWVDGCWTPIAHLTSTLAS